MPLPTEVLLRVHASPVPTQMIFGDCGSIEIAPIDCTVSLSNTGLNVVPPLLDFHTPPLAAPTYTVSRPFSLTAATAATRPLITAEPMLPAPSPEIVSESNLASCASAAPARTSRAPVSIPATAKQRIALRIVAESSAITRSRTYDVYPPLESKQEIFGAPGIICRPPASSLPSL